jgi:DNA mismatch repair protein MutS
LPDASRARIRKKTAKPAPIQLGLFSDIENVIVDKLKKIEISTMTPLDALNCLSELRTQAIQKYENN